MNNTFFVILFCTLIGGCSDVLASEKNHSSHRSKSALDFSNDKKLSDAISDEIKVSLVSQTEFKHIDLKAKFINKNNKVSVPKLPVLTAKNSSDDENDNSIDSNSLVDKITDISLLSESTTRSSLRLVSVSPKAMLSNNSLAFLVNSDQRISLLIDTNFSAHETHDSIDVFNNSDASIANCTERSVSTGSMSRSSSRSGSVSPKRILKNNSSVFFGDSGKQSPARVNFNEEDALVSQSELTCNVIHAHKNGQLNVVEQLIVDKCQNRTMTTQMKSEILNYFSPIAQSIKLSNPSLTFDQLLDTSLESKEHLAVLKVRRMLKLAKTSSTDECD